MPIRIPLFKSLKYVKEYKIYKYLTTFISLWYTKHCSTNYKNTVLSNCSLSTIRSLHDRLILNVLHKTYIRGASRLAIGDFFCSCCDGEQRPVHVAAAAPFAYQEGEAKPPDTSHKDLRINTTYHRILTLQCPCCLAPVSNFFFFSCSHFFKLWFYFFRFLLQDYKAIGSMGVEAAATCNGAG